MKEHMKQVYDLLCQVETKGSSTMYMAAALRILDTLISEDSLAQKSEAISLKNKEE